MLLTRKSKSKSYKMSETPPAEHIGSIVHVDLLPLSNPTIVGNNFYLLTFDEFSGLYTQLVSNAKQQKC